MLSGLILTAFLMGLGGMPHCAAMCGAPCAAAFPRGVPLASLAGRCLGYATLGAIAAVSAGAIARWGSQVAFLQPLWVMLLAAVLLLAVYLMTQGRMPPRVDEWGRALYRRIRGRLGTRQPGPTKRARPWLPLLAGLIWVAMPCGLLYAALMVAALAPSAWGGALVMLAFAVPGAVGIWAAPVLLRGLHRLPWRRFKSQGASVSASASTPAWAGHQGAGAAVNVVPVIWMASAQKPRPTESTRMDSVPSEGFDPRWAVRLSGAMLTVMTGWALYHQLLAQWQAWCA